MNKIFIQLNLVLAILLGCTNISNAQISVSGTVKNKNGRGLSSVNIVDAKNGTEYKTDETGSFIIQVRDSTTLVFKKAGYITQEHLFFLSANKRDIVLVEEHAGRDKVSVAYGTQNFQQLTSAISTVGSETLRKTPAATLSNTLYGRLPGLTVMQTSAEPGYDAPAMFIRGKGTYQNNSLLIFVDGFESSFDQLAVDEIESVSVLKDAAALSLYGIRGANGAILVTTKRGGIGKTKITLNARTGTQEPSRLPQSVSAYDYARLYNEALTNDNLTGQYSAAALEAYRTGSDPNRYPNVNWYDEVLRKSAPLSDYSLTFQGGNTNAKYFILLGYLNNQGLYANTDKKPVANSNANFKKYNFRSNIDLTLNKIVSASFDLGGRLEDRAFPNYDGPTLWNNLARYPSNIYPVKYPNQAWAGNAVYTDNPVAAVLGRGYRTSNDRNLNATMRITEDLGFLLQGLKFSQLMSLNNWHRGNYNRTRSLSYSEMSVVTNPAGEESIVYQNRGNTSDYSVDRGGNDQWNRSNFQLALNYDKLIKEHGLSAMLMYHQDVLKVSGNDVDYATQNIAGRFNYSYQSKYFTELGFSYSGSESFAKGNRFGFFPALSAGWLLSNENFLNTSKVVDFLKLRASAGLVGNDRLAGRRFAYEQDFYYSGGYNLGANNTVWGAIVEGPLGNPNITFEKSLKYNMGVDATLLKRLDITLDLFSETRSDILATSDGSVPSYVGVPTSFQNLGKVNNRGFELDLKFNSKISDFSYYIQAGASMARNKIIEMNEISRPEEYMKRTGHAIDQYFGLEALGLFNSYDEISASPVQSFSPVQPGDIRYKDQNGDGFINEYDEVSLGSSSYPELTYTTTLGAKFKGLHLELFFHGITNRNVFTSGTYFWALINNNNVTQNALNRWTPENAANATYPRLTTLPNENNYRTSSFWMKSGSVLRLRNIELGYSLAPNLLKHLRISSARFFVSGVNLFTWDKIKTVDPEGMGGYPPLKSYNAGLQVQF
ncbi:SusC/RagA family TonB-linked outer membrane protein [Paradesertivirga mongoliensis]|uniref:SusC/RagA family TonB-linked outer membrane protein n=1 Tax=Paradesertivirga mongoliensis TaxID=2100740 RepID=A0ABW4ZPF2_9SPHI|nr:TonB-dependent receptor [Pedobacter mongoliensis]